MELYFADHFTSARGFLFAISYDLQLKVEHGMMGWKEKVKEVRSCFAHVILWKENPGDQKATKN